MARPYSLDCREASVSSIAVTPIADASSPETAPISVYPLMITVPLSRRNVSIRVGGAEGLMIGTAPAPPASTGGSGAAGWPRPVNPRRAMPNPIAISRLRLVTLAPWYGNWRQSWTRNRVAASVHESQQLVRPFFGVTDADPFGAE